VSDHWDAPGMKSPNMDPRVDICDIYAFSTKYEPEIIFVDKKPRNNMKALFGTERLSEVYDF
jgi:hypothetical protein